MSDLPHTYTSDITYPETQVDAADSQFLIQRMGKNINYLIDAIGPVNTNLANIAASALQIQPFDASGSYGPGAHTLLTLTGSIAFGMVFISPANSNLVVSNTGGIGGTVQGPTIPILVGDLFSAGASWVYNYPGGAFNCYAYSSPNYHSLLFGLFGGSSGNFTIKGFVAHGA